jgi:hypothetical protein
MAGAFGGAWRTDTSPVDSITMARTYSSRMTFASRSLP